jgi:hypothetical protein
LIYHHGNGATLLHMAARHRGPKALIHHSITPPSYFAPFNPG